MPTGSEKNTPRWVFKEIFEFIMSRRQTNNNFPLSDGVEFHVF